VWKKRLDGNEHHKPHNTQHTTKNTREKRVSYFIDSIPTREMNEEESVRRQRRRRREMNEEESVRRQRRRRKREMNEEEDSNNDNISFMFKAKRRLIFENEEKLEPLDHETFIKRLEEVQYQIIVEKCERWGIDFLSNDYEEDNGEG
jgi:hypothetical protein